MQAQETYFYIYAGVYCTYHGTNSVGAGSFINRDKLPGKRLFTELEGLRFATSGINQPSAVFPGQGNDTLAKVAHRPYRR